VTTTPIGQLLEERQRQSNPVRVALAGCGPTGRSLIGEILTRAPGMTLAAIAARDPGDALRALTEAGVDDAAVVDGARGLRRSMYHGLSAVTDNFDALTEVDDIDVVIDATATVPDGCRLALGCVANGTHLVSLNTLVEASVGAELRRLADAAGVVVTGCGGALPGVQMNLLRHVRGLGLTPLVSGVVVEHGKSATDPSTESSPGDTAISLAQCVIGNAAGLSVHRRGMLGRDHRGHVDELVRRYDVDELRAMGGAVDFVVGAAPSPAVYCLGARTESAAPHALASFHAPYQWRDSQATLTAARAALTGDASVAALPVRYVEAVAVAKVDLAAGTVLDGPDGYHYYGEVEKAHLARSARLLPVGAAQGCTVVRAVARGAALRYDDVSLPPGRLIDALLENQSRLPASAHPDLFAPTSALANNA